MPAINTPMLIEDKSKLAIFVLEVAVSVMKLVLECDFSIICSSVVRFLVVFSSVVYSVVA